MPPSLPAKVFGPYDDVTRAVTHLAEDLDAVARSKDGIFDLRWDGD